MTAPETPIFWMVTCGAFRLFWGKQEQLAIADTDEAFALAVLLANDDVTINGPGGEVDIEGEHMRASMIRDLMGLVIDRVSHRAPPA